MLMRGRSGRGSGEVRCWNRSGIGERSRRFSKGCWLYTIFHMLKFNQFEALWGPSASALSSFLCCREMGYSLQTLKD